MARRKKISKKKQTPNRERWVISQLRRLSLKWPPRNRAYRESRRELPRKIKKDGTPYKKPNWEHQCNSCKQWFKSSEIAMDHIIPVVDPDSIKSKNEYERIGKYVVSLLCYDDGWQKLCHSCHDTKTAEENKIRQNKKNS